MNNPLQYYNNSFWKIYFFLISFFVLFANYVTAQFIIPENYSINDVFYDINPNRILLSPHSSFSQTTDSLLIDLNNDAQYDFKLVNENIDGGNWYHYTTCKIVPLNQNKVAISNVDTCTANCPPTTVLFFTSMAKAFDVNDTIDENSVWIDTSASLAFNKWNANIPNNCGYGCLNATFGNMPRFVGVGILTGQGTLYGCIKISQTSFNGDTIIVDSYACNLIPTILNREPIFVEVKLFQNNNSNKIIIKREEKDHSNYMIQLFDLMGQLVYEYKLQEHIHDICLNNFSQSIYLLKISNNTKTHTSKIVVHQ